MDTLARDDRTKDGQLALRCAPSNDHRMTVEMIFGLPGFGLDVFIYRAGQNSALFLAAAGGHSETVLFLAEQGMSVNEQGWYGSSLQVAALRGKRTTVEGFAITGTLPVRFEDSKLDWKIRNELEETRRDKLEIIFNSA